MGRLRGVRRCIVSSLSYLVIWLVPGGELEGGWTLMVVVNLYFMSAEQRAAVADIPITPEEQTRLALGAAWDATGRAYATEHSTRPATIALALSTNPLALLAW